MTGIFWAIVALAWLGSGVGVSSGNSLHAAVMFAAALLLAGIAIWMRLTQPIAYRFERGALIVERRRGSARLRGTIEQHVGKATLGLRLGTGGLYGYRGHFHVSTGGWARAFVTDVRRTVLINVGGRRVVLSPIDPAGMVEAVRDA